MMQFEENNSQVDIAELKVYILRQLNPKKPITELTPTYFSSIHSSYKSKSRRPIRGAIPALLNHLLFMFQRILN